MYIMKEIVSLWLQTTHKIHRTYLCSQWRKAFYNISCLLNIRGNSWLKILFEISTMSITFTLNQQIYSSKIIFSFQENFFFFKIIFCFRPVNPNEVPIETSLLVFIRSHARLTGTKFMCLEGGCGACIVNISGIISPTGDSRSIAVNSVYLLIFFLLEYSSNFVNKYFCISVFGLYMHVMVLKLQLSKGLVV